MTVTMKSLKEIELIEYKGKEYVCTDSIMLENENSIVIIATHIYINEYHQITVGEDKICTKVPEDMLYQSYLPEDIINNVVWHPIEMLNKLNDPMMKAIYE